MNQLPWEILNLAIYAFFPVTARIVLQYAVDNRTTVHWLKGLALFAGSIAFGVFLGMLCGISEKLVPMREVTAAVAGFLAKDVIVEYLARAAYYRKHPRALRTALMGWLSRLTNPQKKKK